MNRRRKIRRSDIQKALIAVACIALLVGVGGFFISRWENARYATDGGTGAVQSGSVFSQDTLTIDGKTYTKKKNIRTYLIMGCDNDNEPVTHAHGGQADMQVLVIVDDANKTWRLMPIDRDTIVTMHILDDDGKDEGIRNGQLCLVHAYGSWETGAKNTVNKVSEILGDQKINGYLSTNMDSIELVNDAVGGVPVTVTTDFTEIDDSLVLGEEIVLQGSQAETFGRTRMTVDDGTNESRMKRQEAYFNGLLKKISGLGESQILDIYDKIASNSVTNIGSGDFVELAEITKEYTRLDNIRIEGEHKSVNERTQFHMDEESLKRVILELFFESQEAQ